MNFGYDTPRPHMSHQDPMSYYYDPVRTERESQRDNQISGILQITENTKFKENEIMTDKELKTQADYLKALEICNQADLKDRLKDRYIEFLAAKVDELEKEIFTLMTTGEAK